MIRNKVVLAEINSCAANWVDLVSLASYSFYYKTKPLYDEIEKTIAPIRPCHSPSFL